MYSIKTVRRPGRGTLMLCDHSRAQQEEERLLSFLAGTQPVKSQGLFAYCSLSPLPFPHKRVLYFGWGLMIADPKSPFPLLILNKPIIAGGISVRLFGLGEQKCQSATSPKKPLELKRQRRLHGTLWDRWKIPEYSTSSNTFTLQSVLDTWCDLWGGEGGK